MRDLICPELFLDLTGFSPGKHLNQFLANKMQDFGISFKMIVLSFLTLN